MSISPLDLLGGNSLFKVKQENGQSYLYLTRTVDWHFQNLNALFNTHLGTVKKSVMIYCDAVESTIVGSQRHSLLRKVELERKGEGRATIEPLHHEWIRVRNQHIESIEVSLATPDGNCCGATEGSEQQHNQDLKEIYKGRRILEFITFYHNALHLTTPFTTMHCI